MAGTGGTKGSKYANQLTTNGTPSVAFQHSYGIWESQQHPEANNLKLRAVSFQKKDWQFQKGL
jgi:hypothetical protein